MKVLVSVFLFLISLNFVHASDCDQMEPIDPGFGECLEGELLNEAMDGINQTDFDEEAREIASIDKELEEAERLSEIELSAWDGDPAP